MVGKALAYLRKQELAFDPMQLRLVEPFLGPVDKRQRLGHGRQPFLDLPVFPIRFGQQGQEKTTVSPLPRWLASPLAPSVSDQSRPVAVPVLRHGPSAMDRAERQPRRESVLGREGDRCFSLLLCLVPFPASIDALSLPQ